MRHLDLFSGIGGFALATEMVWDNVEHEFVEHDPFCQAVLKKHWPAAPIHGDIREFVADSKSRVELELAVERKPHQEVFGSLTTDLLTGGFPCQPFSAAGRRKGTADDRYLWPIMLECVALYRPRWVIAENVAGLASWNDGLVLETVCVDLEKEGYEVCPFVIPACAEGAPHRRDRVWIVAHQVGDQLRQQSGRSSGKSRQGTAIGRESHSDAANAPSTRRRQGRAQRGGIPQRERAVGKEERRGFADARGDERWSENWTQVAARLCRVDDGIPRRLDRNPRLKSLGNAIVPQVAAEIMRAIQAADV